MSMNLFFLSRYEYVYNRSFEESERQKNCEQKKPRMKNDTSREYIYIYIHK